MSLSLGDPVAKQALWTKLAPVSKVQSIIPTGAVPANFIGRGIIDLTCRSYGGGGKNSTYVPTGGKDVACRILGRDAELVNPGEYTDFTVPALLRSAETLSRLVRHYVKCDLLLSVVATRTTTI